MRIASWVVVLSLGWCAVASAESPRDVAAPDVPYDAGPGMDAPPEPDAGIDVPRLDTGAPSFDAPTGMDAAGPAPSGGCSVGHGGGAAGTLVLFALLALRRRTSAR